MNLITLIPAYKTKYIADLLNGLRLQTVPAGKIVFSDDSPGGEFRKTLFSEPYAPLRAGLDIEFHDGPRNGAYENFKNLVRLAQGRAELLHILLDDDLIYPEFRERHLLAHAAGDFSCSVSRRWSCSESGQPTQGQPVPEAIRNNPNRMIALDDQVLFVTAVAECNNFLGEFSNAVFRADCADILLDPRLGDVSYAGLWDIGAFVAASMRRPLCHIQDHLGSFRTSPAQNSSNINGPLMKAAHLGHIALAVGGRRLGRLSEELARRNYARIHAALIQRYGDQPDMAPFIAVMPELIQGLPQAQEHFLECWQHFLGANGF
jgi:hypothetical protein